jgi:hypothetical protein
MKVDAHIKILGDKSNVWKTITNIKDFPNVLSGVEKIDLLNQPSNGLVGLKWRETRMYFGKPSAIDKWVVDAVENEHYKTRAEMDGFIFLTTMTVSQVDDSTTLTSTHETKAEGFIAKLKSLPMIFFKGTLKKAILKDLTEIKVVVEQKDKI